MAVDMNGQTYYEVLGVDHRAPAEVIEAAFMALWKLYRPDIKPEHHQIGIRLNEARNILKDKGTRKEYDEALAQDRKRVVGDYRFIKRIAEGGYGYTYLAEHIITGEKVCIKDCLHPDPALDDILIREAKTIWNMRHYSIPSVQNLIRMPNGRLALVMDYIEGRTLAREVENHGTLDPEHVCWIAERTLNVLMYMHFEHGVIHGDIKPQNIIIQDKHMIVLVDYGLSVVKPKSDTKNLGYTRIFAPPEQLKENSPLLPQSDFYSLGMSMIFALCGGNMYQVERKRIPDSTPQPIRDFIEPLVRLNVLERPEWIDQNGESLFDKIQKIRLEVFKRARSNMKPLPGHGTGM